MRARRLVSPAALAAALAVGVAGGVALTWGPPPPSPTPAGSFAFAALGDAPYDPHEALRYRIVERDLAAHDLAWVLHVGDPFWRPCSDHAYRKVRAGFDRLPHPVVYTPGDNEWTDCWETGSGGHEPLERLGRLREIFFATPGRSLGRRPMAVVSQAAGGAIDGAAGSRLAENVRWEHVGVVAATVHLVGSANGLDPFPARTDDDDAEAAARTAAAVAWTRETFAIARRRGAAAVVLGFHADPGFEGVAAEYRKAFAPWPAVLAEEARRFGRPVLAIHGDSHEFRVDRPLTEGWGGPPVPNLIRLEVPGSPDVGWVRVVVTPGAPEPFAFEERTVPRWKHW